MEIYFGEGQYDIINTEMKYSREDKLLLCSCDLGSNFWRKRGGGTVPHILHSL